MDMDPIRHRHAPHVVPREELVCSICLEVLTFPATLPCGHNFDRGCVFLAWKYQMLNAKRLEPETDSADLQSLSCPLCRAVWKHHGVAQELHLNKLVQRVVAQLFPEESQAVGSIDKAGEVSFAAFFHEQAKAQEQALLLHGGSTANASDLSLPPPSPPNGQAAHADSSSALPPSSRSALMMMPLSFASASLAQPPGYIVAWLVLLLMLTMIATPVEWVALMTRQASYTGSSLMANGSAGFSFSSTSASGVFGHLGASLCDQVGNWIETIADLIDQVLPYVQFLDMIF